MAIAIIRHYLLQSASEIMLASRVCFSLFSLVLLCVSSAGSAERPDIPAPQELVRAANDLATRSPADSFHLTASFVITPGKNEEVRGQISFYRDKNREKLEITSGSYHLIRVRLDDHLYILHTDSPPLIRQRTFEHPEKMWSIAFPVPSKVGFGEVSEKKVDGTKAYCFVADPRVARPARYCLDADKRFVLQKDDGFEVTKFLNYRILDHSFYPSEIKFIDEGKLFIDIQNIEVQKREFSSDTFAVPDGSQEFETCDELQPPRWLTPDMPPIPDRRHLVYAAVRGLVDTDGSFHNIGVQVSPPHPDFARDLMDRASRWHFASALCGSRPIAFEEVLDIHN